jgi:hypothetical protein
MIRRTMMASAIAALTASVTAQTSHRQTVLRKMPRRGEALRLLIAQC